VTISFFSASVLKASVSITSFVVTNPLVNGAFSIDGSIGGRVGYGFALGRGFSAPGSSTLEDGSCIVTLVMNVGGVYQNISSPLNIANADWNGSLAYVVNNAFATIPAQASYGPVYLKFQKGTAITYSSMSYGINGFPSGLSSGLQPFIVVNGVYTNDENKTKLFPSVATPALIFGQTISSPNGTYTLTFQADGNVVLYKNGTTALWSTRTQGTGAASLFFKTDGNLAVFNSSGTAVWASNRNNNISNLDNNYFYALQNDGNFVFYYTYMSQTGVKMFYSLGTTNTGGGVVSPNSGFIK
jgi:hypothetical protein